MRFDSKNAVLWSDFRLLWTPNFQKLKNAISLENGKWPSWISHMFWLTYGAQCSAKKNSEKITCRVVFWPGRKIGRNYGPARLRLKMVKIQKFLMTLVFATLWLTDGQKSNFFPDLPYESQGALCERPQNSLFQPQNLNRSPQHCVSPQILTFGLRYIP